MNSAQKKALVASTPTEKRASFRLDKVFPVWVSSGEHGQLRAIARNISSGGIFIETLEPMPLAAEVRVHFTFPGSSAEIVARGEVKNHYFINYAGSQGQRSMTGMGIRFICFEEDGEQELLKSLLGHRILH